MWPEPAIPWSVNLCLPNEIPRSIRCNYNLYLEICAYISRPVYFSIMCVGWEKLLSMLLEHRHRKRNSLPEHTTSLQGKQVKLVIELYYVRVMYVSSALMLYSHYDTGIVLANIDSPHIYSELPTSRLVDEDTNGSPSTSVRLCQEVLKHPLLKPKRLFKHI